MIIEDMINVLHAAERGETIEYRRIGIKRNKWQTAIFPVWDFNHYEYRIKPNLGTDTAETREN